MLIGEERGWGTGHGQKNPIRFQEKAVAAVCLGTFGQDPGSASLTVLPGL